MFAVCRLSPESEIPAWALGGPFVSIAKSSEELSVVCREDAIPEKTEREEGVRLQKGWRALRVADTLDAALVGVMASLAIPLARARVSLLAVSTFDTDYLLVRDQNLDRALEALAEFGHRVEGRPERPAEEEPESRSGDEPERREKPVEKRPKEPKRTAPAPSAEAVAEAPAEPEAAAAEPDDREAAPAVDRREAAPREAVPREAVPRERKAPHLTPLAAPKPAARDEDDARPGPPGRRRGRERDRQGDDDVTSDGLYAGAIPQHDVETTDLLFSALGLSEPILATVSALGFVHPTPIQSAVIPLALEGRDVIGLAETGSGKTAAFALPLAERLTHGRGIRGLILCPTREIALQTKAFLDIFGRDHELNTVVVIGGVRMSPQIQGLRRNPDIIVATPGRLADHLRRRNVKLDQIEHLVLDEADHMLDLGFLPQIKEILEQVREKRQTMMFSATMPPPIERLTQQFMDDPARSDFRPEGHAASGIEHRLYLVKDEDDRRNCLFRLLREEPGSTLVFVRRKLHTEWLARQLELAGFPVARIHSDRSQGQRVSALRGFREGEHEVLVATDVAARGIDVPGIRHVINYGLPEAVEDYVHRAGRTARGSAVGIVSSIGTWQDKETVREIEHALGQKLKRSAVEGVEPYRELKPRRTVRRRRLL